VGGGGGMVGAREHVLLQEPQARDAAKGGAAVRLAALEQREAPVEGLAAREKPQQILRIDEAEVVAARGGAVAEHVQRRHRGEAEARVNLRVAPVRGEGTAFSLRARYEQRNARAIYSTEVVAARDEQRERAVRHSHVHHLAGKECAGAGAQDGRRAAHEARLVAVLDVQHAFHPLAHAALEVVAEGAGGSERTDYEVAGGGELAVSCVFDTAFQQHLKKVHCGGLIITVGGGGGVDGGDGGEEGGENVGARVEYGGGGVEGGAGDSGARHGSSTRCVSGKASSRRQGQGRGADLQ
jgi:hypothetical protein